MKKFEKFGLKSIKGSNTQSVKPGEFDGQHALIAQPTPQGKGKSYRFEMSDLLQQALAPGDDDTYVSFVYDEVTEGRIYIANVTEFKDSVPDALKVYKNGSFSGAADHKYLNKILPWFDTQDKRQCMKATKVENIDQNVFLLEPMDDPNPPKVVKTEGVDQDVDKGEDPNPPFGQAPMQTGTW